MRRFTYQGFYDAIPQYIDGNTIVDLTKNVPMMTGSEITTVRPSKPVDKIIEFNAGFADANNIKIGDTVKFKN